MTTDPGAALLRTICLEPEDVGARLVYADWLEDSDPERAEFVRVQCELADKPGGPDWWDRDHLRRRERELLDVSGFAWFTDFARASGAAGAIHLDRNAWHFRVLGGPLDWCQFRRGFVEAVACPEAAWRQHGPAIVQAQPVRELTLVDARTEMHLPTYCANALAWARRQAGLDVPCKWCVTATGGKPAPIWGPCPACAGTGWVRAGTGWVPAR